jgi:segregation and condensation protein A
MNRFEAEKNKPVHKVIQYAYTIETQKESILNRVREERNVSFNRLFEFCENRIHAIFTFLSLLELIQQRLLVIQIGIGKNNFWLNPAETTSN